MSAENPNKRDTAFSNLDRSDRLHTALAKSYDLIVIGGGITGAGIALDASLRGLSTLLLEKGDFASGTSSKSTKLIHGGLRYLKQLEFGLVRETGLERAVAHHNIPHLVHPESMLLPIVENGSFGKFSASIAISVYDWLADVPSNDRKQSLNIEETTEREPLLKQTGLKGGIEYSEYRTDDARLTIELIKAAKRNGADIFNYVEVNSFKEIDGKLRCVLCEDKLSNDKLKFTSQQIVSAAGPWVDELRSVNGSLGSKSLHLTKGVHIVVPKEKLPVKSAVYFDVFDGRMIFAIPRGEVTYIGTSDTTYDNDLDRVLCTKTDVAYILKAVNHMFDVSEIKEDDVISSWAGLRPLIYEEGKSPSDLSRKDEIFESDNGLISIAGGKLTGFRKMALRIVDLVLERNPDFAEKECVTETYKIHSDSFEDYDSFLNLVDSLYADYSDKGITKHMVWYLVSTYGKHAATILKSTKDYNGSIMEQILKAEITYVINFEAASLPDDYFNRRSGRLYFDVHNVTSNLELIVSAFADRFEWSNDKKHFEMHRCQSLIKDVTVFN